MCIVGTQEAVAHRKNSREGEQMLSGLTGKALESEGDAGLVGDMTDCE